MIKVTKMNGEDVVVNALLIEVVESTPDTIITLTTGHKIMVKDAVDDVVTRAKEYHQATGFHPAGRRQESREE